MRTLFPAPGLPSSPELDEVDEREKRRVDASDRFGFDRSDDSRRSEIDSSDVKVRERKRVENLGARLSFS